MKKNGTLGLKLRNMFLFSFTMSHVKEEQNKLRGTHGSTAEFSLQKIIYDQKIALIIIIQNLYTPDFHSSIITD